MIQEDLHIFQGLRRDNHQIRQKSEYLWDAHNIRLTNRDDSTLLSITNERGTEDTGISFIGKYVGHCVLNNYLIVFTYSSDNTAGYYRIYRVEYKEQLESNIIFEYKDNNSRWGKGWTPEHPIQAFGYYESELVQKVYWIDDVNQPRVINITKKELLDKENFLNLYDKDSFDFVRTLKLEENVTVEKLYSYGEFAPGVIQYAFSYYDKYGQESNIFYTTPLYYLSHIDRAGSPEDKVSNSFKITIDNVDNFEYVRIYSIHRTSIDAVPVVKVVNDIKINDSTIEYTDTGTEGYVIDNTQLLYIGGRSIIAKTFTQKDNTLFLGNITQSNNNTKKIGDIILNSSYEFNDIDIQSYRRPIGNNVYYDYSPSLDKYNAGFKTNEHYRCGVQAQLNDGTWTEPIFIDDVILSDKYRWETINTLSSKSLKLNLSSSDKAELEELGVVKLRACIVFPRYNEREVLCQGVLNPTLYFETDRRYHELFSVASWFFRPIIPNPGSKDNQSVDLGSSIIFNHGDELPNGNVRSAEIQGNSRQGEESDRRVFIDENVLTFHSPDVEFDTNIQNYIWDDTYLRIVGIASLGAISGDIDIQTKSPARDRLGGINTYKQGYTTGIDTNINGGLVTGMFYKDISEDTLSYFPVFPFHRSGSLNNDNKHDDGSERTAVLDKKVISNLKFFDENKSVLPVSGSTDYDMVTPQLFMSDELTLLRYQPVYLNQSVGYMGNVNKLITLNTYQLYKSDSQDGNFINAGSSNDPISIKYKSTPHLMFSLKGINKEYPILPRLTSDEDKDKDVEDVDPGEDTKLDYTIDKYTPDDIDYTLSYLVRRSLAPPSGVTSIPEGQIVIYQITPTNTGGSNRVPNSNETTLHLVNSIDVDNKKWILMKPAKSIYRLKVDKEHTFIVGGSIGRGLNAFDNKIRGLFKESEFDDEGNYIGEDRYIELKFDIGNPEKGILSINDITNLVNTETVSALSESTRGTVSQTRDYFSLIDDADTKPYLWIAEICRKKVINKFGDKESNLWFPAGEPISIDDDIDIPFMYGDTWYSRYDCLKTYPFTKEDENQIVEIGSFMCETRVNIDGRYDRNRGRTSNLEMSPENFNKINEVYSQKDSFFDYRILDESFYKNSAFANQLTWSKEKIIGEDIDTWTNITLANTLDVNGEKGKITSLATYNDVLLCLQDKSISQIMFNNRVQIPVSDGVPIEISNGNKVDGYRTISDSAGCQNKWSVINTSSGVFFVDNFTDSIYNFNGQLVNVSDTLGVKWWVQNNHFNDEWNPYNGDNVRSFYDPLYMDVYFTPGNNDAICYSEYLNGFISQYSYGGTQAMFPFNDEFMSLRDDGELKLYKNFKGKYNDFFGNTKGWDFTFISNSNSTITKVFNNVELRTDHWDEDNNLLNTFPIGYINVKNEYQEAGSKFNGINVKKKFRVWRGLIPRNNGTMQRVRNLWSGITLGLEDNVNNNKVVIHDVNVKYTI